MYWLDILNGAARGRRKIQRRIFTAGSDLSCQLWLSEGGVAPRHVTFEERDAGVLVRPMEAGIALRVNGDAIESERLLADGDTVEVGTVRIRYRARIHPLVQGLPILAGAASLILVAGGTAYGIWHYIRHRAGLDRADLPIAAAPVVVVPEAPVTMDPPQLAAMERIGQSPRPTMTSATTGAMPDAPAVQTPSAPAVVAPPASPPATTQAPPVRVEAPPAATITQKTEVATRPAPATVPETDLVESPAPPVVAVPPKPAASPAPAPAEPPISEPVPQPMPPAPPVSTSAPVAVTAVPVPVPAAPEPVPAPTPPPTPPPSPAVVPAVARPAVTNIEPPLSRSVVALAQAEALLRAGSLEAAAEKAALAVAEDPRLMPARALQARIAERRGRSQEAERLWTLVLQNSAGAPLYDEAFKELVRLAELQMDQAPPPLTTVRTSAPPAHAVSPTPKAPAAPAPLVTATTAPPVFRVPDHMTPIVEPGATPRGAQPAPAPSPPAPQASTVAPVAVPSPPPPQPVSRPSPPPPPPTPTPRPAPEPVRPPQQQPAPEVPPPSIRIASAEMTRFPPPSDQMDFRVLEVALSAGTEGSAFPSDRVSVEVVFYDRSEPPGRVFPSRIVPSRGRVTLAQGRWNPGETKSVVVPYAVAKAAAETDTTRFHGFRVRVYTDGRLVQEQARPAGLPAAP